VAASVSYAATNHKATLDPTDTLKRGAYRAVVTTDAKDLAGNRLDQDPTLAGLQQGVWNPGDRTASFVDRGREAEK
jgi:hypothetical protein